MLFRIFCHVYNVTMLIFILNMAKASNNEINVFSEKYPSKNLRFPTVLNAPLSRFFLLSELDFYDWSFAHGRLLKIFFKANVTAVFRDREAAILATNVGHFSQISGHITAGTCPAV